MDRVYKSQEWCPVARTLARIHHVTCDAQGEVHLTLEELQAGADGHTEATTTDFPEEDPDRELNYFAAGHYIAVHDTVGGQLYEASPSRRTPRGLHQTPSCSGTRRRSRSCPYTSMSQLPSPRPLPCRKLDP